MLAMAAVAVRRLRNRPGRLAPAEGDECPAAPESLRILDVDLEAHHITRLISSMAIDGTLLRSAAILENENRPVDPCTGAQKFPVSPRIDEHVVERGMLGVAALLRVAHVEPRAQVNPFAIVPGKLEPSVGGVLRSRRRSAALDGGDGPRPSGPAILGCATADHGNARSREQCDGNGAGGMLHEITSLARAILRAVDKGRREMSGFARAEFRGSVPACCARARW